MKVIAAILGIVLAGCSSKKTEAPPLPEKPVVAPAVVAPAVKAAPVIAPPHGCPPSAYRNGGNEIRPILDAVFPGCPPAELDEALVCIGRACERPCKVTTTSTVRNDEPVTFTVEVTADATGRVNSVQRGGSFEMFTYDPQGRLASWEPAPLPAHVITRNAQGSIAKVTAGERSWSFGYDAAGRVTGLVYDGSRMTLTYDEQGREIREQDGGHASTFAYDAAGRLVRRATEWDDTLSYDAKGRLVKIESAEVLRRDVFTYDDLGRVITQVSTRPEGQAQYVNRFEYCR